MKVRVKKQDEVGIRRLEGIGEIREIMINQDFLDPGRVSVSLFFKGSNTSGIIDLMPEEIEMLNKEMSSKKAFLKKAKILKFKK